jgi:hypothetical protein
VTTGDHLFSTIERGYWPVAAIDIVLSIISLIAAVSASRLQRRACVAERDLSEGQNLESASDAEAEGARA